MTQLKKEINDLLPLYVDDARCGFGSFLTFDMHHVGLPDRRFHLWIYLCRWWIQDSKGCVLWVSDDEKADELMQKIAGCCLLSYSKSDRIHCFGFSNGFELMLTPDLDEYCDDDELFRLYVADSECFSYSPSTDLILTHDETTQHKNSLPPEKE